MAHWRRKLHPGSTFALDEKTPEDFLEGFIQAEAENEVDAVRDRTTALRRRYPPIYRSGDISAIGYDIRR
jgi:hypothetical protein